MKPDLVLVACSKAKAKLGPGEVRSPRGLYGPSALFRGAVRSAERRGIPWAVLSAKHEVFWRCVVIVGCDDWRGTLDLVKS